MITVGINSLFVIVNFAVSIDFLFLLLTDEAIHNTAIPSIDYTFYQLCDATSFQSIHVEVVSLLSTTQSFYHLAPSGLVLPSNTNVFNCVVNDSRYVTMYVCLHVYVGRCA